MLENVEELLESGSNGARPKNLAEILWSQRQRHGELSGLFALTVF